MLIQTSSIKNPMFAYAKIFLLIEDAKDFKTDKMKRMLIIAIHQKHRMKCLNETCPCIKYIKILNDKNFKNIKKKSIEEKNKKCKLYLDGDINVISRDINIVKFDSFRNHLKQLSLWMS